MSAPPGLSSSSWEIYPKAPHIPSSIHTAQGDALMPVAFPHSIAAGSCLPALVRSQRQLSSPPPLTFLLESPSLIFSFGQLSPHLSQIHCMQCLSWAHTLLLTQVFQSSCSSPTKRFKCKAVSEMSVTCHRTSEREEATNTQTGSCHQSGHRATYTNTQLLTELPQTDSTGGTLSKAHTKLQPKQADGFTLHFSESRINCSVHLTQHHYMCIIPLS